MAGGKETLDSNGIGSARIEHSFPKEKLVPLVNVITISGPSGTGKTVFANMLGELLGMEVLKVGERIREWVKEETGEDMIGFTKRTPQHDQAVDRKTAEKIRNAILEGKKLIVEGRLAGWVCKKVLNEEFGGVERPLAYTIFLKGEREIAHYRVWHREVEKNPNLTLEEVSKATSERDKKDQEAWALAYPELSTNSPQNPNCVDSKGNPVYDQITDTEGLKPIGVLASTAGEMYRKRLVRIIRPEPTPEPSNETDIFKAA